ncbi:MAG: hypothetical protein Q4Q06_05010 [Bacteroidota bacterium]|nr:hypothetical protein [Bacteroidota bacterium]
MTDYEMRCFEEHDEALMEELEQRKKEVRAESGAARRDVERADSILINAIIEISKYLRQKEGFNYCEWEKHFQWDNAVKKFGECMLRIEDALYDADDFVE